MRIQFHIIFLTGLFILFFLVGSAQKIYYSLDCENMEGGISEDSTNLLFSVYLIGDIKYPLPESENLKLLKTYISKESKRSAVAILGDILYPMGLRDSADKHFNEDELNLKHILNTFDNFEGEIVFMPGNHDWARGNKQGWETVLNEEQYIEQYLKRGNVFLPDGGCPGPVEIELSQDITLIVFDSQWWFQKYDKPGSDGECGFIDDEDLFIQIEDAIRRNRDKKVIFAAHHPLYSVG